MFQYISCYSLSESRFCMECGSRSFNTSHVTLYRKRNCRNVHRCIVSIHLMLLFIKMITKELEKLDGFNTSHVTLYQLSGFAATSISICFNTSHVTLYPGRFCPQVGQMVFQYISCYSLSF